MSTDTFGLLSQEDKIALQRIAANSEKIEQVLGWEDRAPVKDMLAVVEPAYCNDWPAVIEMFSTAEVDLRVVNSLRQELRAGLEVFDEPVIIGVDYLCSDCGGYDQEDCDSACGMQFLQTRVKFARVEQGMHRTIATLLENRPKLYCRVIDRTQGEEPSSASEVDVVAVCFELKQPQDLTYIRAQSKLLGYGDEESDKELWGLYALDNMRSWRLKDGPWIESGGSFISQGVHRSYYYCPLQYKDQLVVEMQQRCESLGVGFIFHSFEELED